MQKRVSLLVVPLAIALQGLTAYAADAVQSSSPPAQADAMAASPAALAADSATPATTPASAQHSQNVSFGVAMSDQQLDERRGGDALVGQNFLNGTLSDNVANKVSTGSNTISDGSFASSSGLPTVIQNTGANVLIQNATVLNVRFGN
ncbi:hypothetical protein [Paraburkholderia mimosarum]|uniref:hypothetical protein n=1 Tax=Paraburkholderia mimosarum TaxID=312026 RepID=UPI001FC873B3|nr:hypothetical protein [Paraburkholderia mimosarum]